MPSPSSRWRSQLRFSFSFDVASVDSLDPPPRARAISRSIRLRRLTYIQLARTHSPTRRVTEENDMGKARCPQWATLMVWGRAGLRLSVHPRSSPPHLTISVANQSPRPPNLRRLRWRAQVHRRPSQRQTLSIRPQEDHYHQDLRNHSSSTRM